MIRNPLGEEEAVGEGEGEAEAVEDLGRTTEGAAEACSSAAGCNANGAADQNHQQSPSFLQLSNYALKLLQMGWFGAHLSLAITV